MERKRTGNLFIIGFMGTGKSSVGKRIGEREEHMTRIELDDLIEREEGISVKEIFDQFGEEYFRDCETSMLHEMKLMEDTVVSCGGGIVLREENIRYMKEAGTVVLLKAAPETVLARVKDSDERPILNGNMNVPFIRALMEKRRERYELAKDFDVVTDDKTIDAVCDAVLAEVKKGN